MAGTVELRGSQNLLIRLYRHRPHKNTTPEENFITECFAIALSFDRNLLEVFFSKFIKASLPDSLYIDTQVPFDNSVFDLVFTDDKEFYYVVECKMKAPFSRTAKGDNSDQLDKYAEALDKVNFKRKALISITLKKRPEKQYPGINFVALRWLDVIEFLQDCRTQEPVAELFRQQFIELLKFRKADRTLVENRLLWKCDICCKETRGYGIQSHKQKHCDEYSKLFEDEYKERSEDLRNRLLPYQQEIDFILERTKGYDKIELNTYSNALPIFSLFERSGLPKAFWLYAMNCSSLHFSNNARSKFITELKEKAHGVPQEEAPMPLPRSYEELLRLLGRLETTS